MLDLFFVIGQLQGDLALEDITINWFPWTNHSEVALWLMGTIYLHGEAGSVGLASPPQVINEHCIILERPWVFP